VTFHPEFSMRLVTFLVLVIAALLGTGCDILEPEITIPALCGITYAGPECTYRLSPGASPPAASDSVRWQ
jgi:hypothetical protein